MITITDSCCCGAKFMVDASYFYEEERGHRDWLEAHAVCRAHGGDQKDRIDGVDLRERVGRLIDVMGSAAQAIRNLQVQAMAEADFDDIYEDRADSAWKRLNAAHAEAMELLQAGEGCRGDDGATASWSEFESEVKRMVSDV